MREMACEDCRTWEEELYWAHFQYIHFSQFLLPGFDKRLAIPDKFTKNLRRKLPDTVTLKSPSGTTWEVCLTAHENTLFFDQGWHEFVEDHFLEENDILVFKYNGESCFDVLMFDGQSMCEKTGSYFLTQCLHKEQNSTGCHTKRKTGESSAEVLSASPEDDNGGSRRKKSTHNNVYTTPSGQPVISRVGNRNTRREIKFEAAISTPKTARKQESCTCAEDAEAKADIVHTPLCLSSRRWIPEEDKLNVLRAAQAAVTAEGFVIVMKPTHVTKKYFTSIPWVWVAKHITSHENQYVILRIKEKTWQVRLYYRKRPNRAALACGWKNFVLDNKIQEWDVVAFEPGRLLNNMVVLDVTIFHIVQEANPASPVSM